MATVDTQDILGVLESSSLASIIVSRRSAASYRYLTRKRGIPGKVSGINDDTNRFKAKQVL
jgi:hypothetical protein